jgi:curved DNA-binding protein CbpA
MSQIQEAYETLVNASSRADYDASYRNLQHQWRRYREDSERWKRDEIERMSKNRCAVSGHASASVPQKRRDKPKVR